MGRALIAEALLRREWEKARTERCGVQPQAGWIDRVVLKASRTNFPVFPLSVVGAG